MQFTYINPENFDKSPIVKGAAACLSGGKELLGRVFGGGDSSSLSSASASASSPESGGLFSGLRDMLSFGDKSPEPAVAVTKERAVEVSAPVAPAPKDYEVSMCDLGSFCPPTFSSLPAASRGAQIG